MKVLCTLLFFYGLGSNAQKSINEFVSLATSVREFYGSHSVFVVFDHHRFGFNKEKMLVEAMRSYSSQESMVQMIDYNDLEKALENSENTLYALVIWNRKNLENAINLTKNCDISAHPWLLFLMDENLSFYCNEPGEDFFKLRMDTKMMAKCEGNNILKIYYAVFENQTEVRDLAKWTSEKKLDFVSKKSLVKVETDFKGIKLKVAKRTKEINDANENLENYVTNITKELSILGNFQMNVTFRNDAGGYFDNKTQKWIGLMEAVVNKKVDIALVLISMSPDRIKVVDFVMPIYSGSYYLYAKLPDNSPIPWATYFKAFKNNSWIAIGTIIVISSILFFFMEKRISGRYSLIDSFVHIWSIYNQQGSSEIASTASIRILHSFILISSLILNIIYSSSIASYITALEIKLPFSSYEEFKNDNTYQFSVVKDSIDQALIEGNDSLLTPLRHLLKDGCDLPNDASEGFQQVCEDKTVFYTDKLDYKGVTEQPTCKISSIKINRMEYLSFFLPKNSPYTATFSYFILRLREHGILDKLENQFFYNYTEIFELQTNVISFEESLPIFAILVIGVIAAIFVYFLELIMYHTCRPIKMKKLRCRNGRVFKNRKKVTFQRSIRFKIRLLIMHNDYSSSR